MKRDVGVLDVMLLVLIGSVVLSWLWGAADYMQAKRHHKGYLTRKEAERAGSATREGREDRPG